jgi:hypothetical protein
MGSPRRIIPAAASGGWAGSAAAERDVHRASRRSNQPVPSTDGDGPTSLTMACGVRQVTAVQTQGASPRPTPRAFLRLSWCERFSRP